MPILTEWQRLQFCTFRGHRGRQGEPPPATASPHALCCDTPCRQVTPSSRGETHLCRARAAGILPGKVGQVISPATRYSHRHSLLTALKALQRAKFVPLLKTKIGTSHLIPAICSPSDQSNTQQEAALGKPYLLCGARIQTEICKTEAPFKHLFVTHLIIDVLDCKNIFLSKLLICLPGKPQVKDT